MMSFLCLSAGRTPNPLPCMADILPCTIVLSGLACARNTLSACPITCGAMGIPHLLLLLLKGQEMLAPVTA